MNKKMRELQSQMADLQKEAEVYLNGEKKDLEAAKGALDKIDELKEEFNLQERCNQVAKGSANLEKPQTPTVDSFKAFGKMISGRPLDPEEKALITGTSAANGENYLIPEDIKTEINMLRKSYVSARDIVDVIRTSSLTGALNYECGTPAGLTAFEDGTEIATESDIKFEQRKFSIGWYGKIIPVSRILIDAERAALMAYINQWFVRDAIVTENKKIFATLKSGYNAGTPKAVTGWEALKYSMTVDLDPSCLIGGVIATNQTGFATLDKEKDAQGRPILQYNPANPTERLFQGLPIKIYPDAQFANVVTYVKTADTDVTAGKTYYTLSGGEYTAVESPVKANLGTYYEEKSTAPMVYGNTAAACKLIEHKALQFATSEHYLFGKNQNCIRVLEGFDVISGDKDAAIFATFEGTN